MRVDNDKTSKYTKQSLDVQRRQKPHHKIRQRDQTHHIPDMSQAENYQITTEVKQEWMKNVRLLSDLLMGKNGPRPKLTIMAGISL